MVDQPGALQQVMCLIDNNDDDLTDAVERDGEHYHICIGEHSDVWRGIELEVDEVPTLDVMDVLRGGSSSRPDHREQPLTGRTKRPCQYPINAITSSINFIKTAGISSPGRTDPPNNFDDVTFNFTLEDDHPESSYWGQSQNVQTFSMARHVSMRNSEINNVGGNLTVNNYHVYLQPDSELSSTWDLWARPFSDLKLRIFHAAERVENFLARFK